MIFVFLLEFRKKWLSTFSTCHHFLRGLELFKDNAIHIGMVVRPRIFTATSRLFVTYDRKRIHCSIHVPEKKEKDRKIQSIYPSIGGALSPNESGSKLNPESIHSERIKPGTSSQEL
jgi:hypothetical protein